MTLLFGYGFPRWRGGLLFYAQEVGLASVSERIREYDEVMDYWEPAPLLQRMV